MWNLVASLVHMQPSCSLHTINFEHEVSELTLPVVAHLAAAGEEMTSIFLDTMIYVLDHEFKTLINGTNE